MKSSDENQVHRGAHLEIDSILMGSGVFQVEVEGGLDAAWENTAAAVKRLAEQRAALLEAAQRVMAHRVGDLPTRGDLRDNDASRRDIAALAQAIANAAQQRKEPGA